MGHGVMGHGVMGLTCTPLVLEFSICIKVVCLFASTTLAWATNKSGVMALCYMVVSPRKDWRLAAERWHWFTSPRF